MRKIATMALMLTFGVAAAYAQQGSVNITVSGTETSNALNLQAGTSADTEDFAGSGTFGQFTFHGLGASTAAPQPSSTCSGANLIHFSRVVGAGVFRFQDGSMLTINLTHGDDCIDLSANLAHCTWTYQVTGGTGRFNGATGTVTLAETVVPALTDAFANPIFFAVTGSFTGTISGVGQGQGNQDR